MDTDISKISSEVEVKANIFGCQKYSYFRSDVPICAVHHRLGEGLPFRGMFVKIPIRDHREQGNGHLDCHRGSFGFGKKNITILMRRSESSLCLGCNSSRHHGNVYDHWGLNISMLDKLFTILMYFSPINIKIPHISFSPDMNFQ